MVVLLLLLTSPPRTLRAVGGGSAAGPSHSRRLATMQRSSAMGGRAEAARLSRKQRCLSPSRALTLWICRWRPIMRA